MLAQERRNLCKTPEHQKRMHRRSGIEATHSELARAYGIRRSRLPEPGKDRSANAIHGSGMQSAPLGRVHLLAESGQSTKSCMKRERRGAITQENEHIAND
jgi:hypothetical protein